VGIVMGKGDVPNSSGAGGGVGGSKEKVPVVPKKVKALAKTTCLVCKTTTNSVAANKSGAVKCSVYDGWWHPHCVQMAPETFQTGPWLAMRVCGSANPVTELQQSS
jgi:hypothetical protein